LDRIPVSLGDRSYEIAVGHGIIGTIGEEMVRLKFGPKMMLITSHTVWPLYGKTVHESLTKRGFNVATYLLNDDEEAKSLQTVTAVIDDLLENGLDRSSAIVAVGGGVVGDIAGFAAATYMRGIPYVQVPTTLLAQIDSSIGGKTGVNRPKAKNLVGAFHQPKLVWSDVSTLATLPEREFRSGMTEAIKYSIIADPSLSELLTANAGTQPKISSDVLVEIVSRCCSIKAGIVEKDEKEHGIRSILNYGHTVGHALESLTEYTAYTHGEAIAIGMIAAARISRDIGATGPETVAQHESMIRAFGLPDEFPRSISPASILKQIGADKKRMAGRARWILARRIGEVFVTSDVPADIVLRALVGMTAPGK
jgi:3-dehydroquinate synthase